MISQSEYQSISERIKKLNKWRSENPEAPIPSELSVKPEDRSKVEMFDWKTVKPKTYLAWMNHEDGYIETYMGDKLGEIIKVTKHVDNKTQHVFFVVSVLGYNKTNYIGLHTQEAQDLVMLTATHEFATDSIEDYEITPVAYWRDEKYDYGEGIVKSDTDTIVDTDGEVLVAIESTIEDKHMKQHPFDKMDVCIVFDKNGRGAAIRVKDKAILMRF